MTQTVSSHLRNVVRSGQSSKAFSPADTPFHARRCFIAIVIAACCLTGSLRANAVQSVTLAWDRSTDSSAVGYRIYAYEENVAAPTSFNAFGLTQMTLPGLKEGLRYTFTVTSYNAAGVESAPSSPAEYTVPVPLQILPGTTPEDLKRLQFPMATGHWYEIQASTNMTTWTTIQQTSVATGYGWTNVQEMAPPTKRTQRFFRLKIH